MCIRDSCNACTQCFLLNSVTTVAAQTSLLSFLQHLLGSHGVATVSDQVNVWSYRADCEHKVTIKKLPISTQLLWSQVRYWQISSLIASTSTQTVNHTLAWWSKSFHPNSPMECHDIYPSLCSTAIKGAIWYQGEVEANVGENKHQSLWSMPSWLQQLSLQWLKQYQWNFSLDRRNSSQWNWHSSSRGKCFIST